MSDYSFRDYCLDTLKEDYYNYNYNSLFKSKLDKETCLKVLKEFGYDKLLSKEDFDDFVKECLEGSWNKMIEDLFEDNDEDDVLEYLSTLPECNVDDIDEALLKDLEEDSDLVNGYHEFLDDLDAYDEDPYSYYGVSESDFH